MAIQELVREIRSTAPAKVTRFPADARLLEGLQEALADELTAKQQYLGHYGVMLGRGYKKLAAVFEEKYADEHGHAKLLLARISLMGGVPVMNVIHPLAVGVTLPEQLANDKGLELGAVAKYNALSKLAREVGDASTAELVESLLEDEVEHVREWQEVEDMIADITLANYLSLQG